MGQMMSLSRRFLILALVNLLLCMGVRAQEVQQQGNDRRTQSRDVSNSVRSPESRDLAKDNLDRVAASAVQLQAVLLKDPGILVELKRWVANEATNSGQIVDDASLSDQAIFDRLESDVEFRSIATRLVQRYGYLLPSVNPESEIAKEQDLVMKERVRRLAARQEKADQDSLAAEEAEKNPEQRQSRVPRTICDPQSQTNCNDTSSTRGRQRGNSMPDESPAPGNNQPLLPDQISPSDANRTLRSAVGRDDAEPRGYSSMESASLTSDSLNRAPGGLSGSMPSTGMDGIDSLMQRSNLDDLSLAGALGNRSENTGVSGRESNRTVRVSSERELGYDRNMDRRDLSRYRWSTRAIPTPTSLLSTTCTYRLRRAIARRSALAWTFSATEPARWMRFPWIFRSALTT